MLIFNSLHGSIGIVQIIVIALIVYSILDLIESFTIAFSLKKDTDPTEGKIVEAQYKEKK